MALVPKGNPKDEALNLPWLKMFRSASLWLPKKEEEAPPPKKLQSKGEALAVANIGGLSLEPDARLAPYIVMAHAGLAMALLVLYGLYRLLADFLWPLQKPLLRGGLSAAVLALPLAAVRSCGATLANVRAALPPSPSFPRLLRWLISSLLFLLLERLNTTAVLVLLAFFAASPKPSSFLSRTASSRIAGRTPSFRGLLPSLGPPSTTSHGPSLPPLLPAVRRHRRRLGLGI
ncbi:hypothetical protein E2562_026885 [Oryza meyeriana var. granulata]|uniref:Uncharacterized protein n=1 Tax=Oryza meyeriana var. granulata TaxID=110450 RepID=A0A6G1EPM7_9ORYZ|nr:hypothetical protein E2562_026885 [Oryza meyeriana var. granulata]